jgi:hypothetical protein
LPEIGLTAAPILARSLANNDRSAEDAVRFFVFFTYEPVIPVLVQLASDRKGTHSFIQFGPEDDYELELGDWAVLALENFARTSEIARAGLISALSKGPRSKRFLEWLKPWELLGDDFKPSRQGKRAPKRARNTG